jgi:hypothetical protein
LPYLQFCVATFLDPLVATASDTVTTEAPRWPHGQRGEIPDGLSGPPNVTNAPFAEEVQSFVTGNLSAPR